MKYYITKETKRKIIWGTGTTKSSSMLDAKKFLDHYSKYNDYSADLETLRSTKKLFDSINDNGWSRQKYIIVDGVAGYKSEFKKKLA